MGCCPGPFALRGSGCSAGWGRSRRAAPGHRGGQLFAGDEVGGPGGAGTLGQQQLEVPILQLGIPSLLDAGGKLFAKIVDDLLFRSAAGSSSVCCGEGAAAGYRSRGAQIPGQLPQLAAALPVRQQDDQTQIVVAAWRTVPVCLSTWCCQASGSLASHSASQSGGTRGRVAGPRFARTGSQDSATAVITTPTMGPRIIPGWVSGHGVISGLKALAGSVCVAGKSRIGAARHGSNFCILSMGSGQLS